MNERGHGLLFPCYTLMTAKCTGIAMPRDTDSFTTVVFTNEDRLKDFKSRGPMKFGPTVKFDGAQEFLFYLEALPPNVTHFGVDPEEPGRIVVTVAVTDMKAELRKLLDQNQD